MPETMIDTTDFEAAEGWTDWKTIDGQPAIFFFVNGSIRVAYPCEDKFKAYRS